MVTTAPSPAPMSPDATVALLERARGGDEAALDELLARCLPRLLRWAHGRLPPAARGMHETADVVQEAVMAAVRRLDRFEVRHQGALQAYLRQCIMNRIVDLVRRERRRPAQVSLPDHLVDDGASPIAQAIGAENLQRYETALARLADADREAIIGRLELQYSYQELAVALGKPSPDAARVAVARAMKRLAREMHVSEP